MNKPIQFITIDKEGRCGLTKEAEDMINKIDDNIGVICVAGLYRTGKSYLLNRILGRQDGFEIGPTINSCTKGLWIWGEPIKMSDKNMQVLLIDTEGLGSAFEDRNETIDMEIFCLGVLLSSLFIYNSMKNIDENAVESLSLVINFAKKIQSSFKEIDNYANNFPSLLWVLRDFALELVDGNGKKLTASQYLENALKLNETEDNDETLRKNEIRKLLTIFFKERDCSTLIRPVNDEKKLRNIDKLPKSDLRSEFLTQMDDVVKKIYNSVRPKVVQGSYINGKMYLNLVKMYVDSLNNNSIPDVKTSWKIVLDKQMDEVFDKSLNFYIDEMLNIDYKKINKIEDLLKHHNEFKMIAYDYLREFANINVPLTVYIDLMKRLEEKINDQFNEFVVKWNEMSVKQCKEIAGQIINDYKENHDDTDKTDVFSTLDILEDVLKLIEESVSSEKKYESMYPKIVEFFVEVLKREFKKVKSKSDNDISTLKHEKNVLQGIIEKTKDLLDRTRDDYDSEIKELKEEKQNMRLDFESKLDEKGQMIKTVQYANDNTVEELKSRINLLNSLLENKKKEEMEKKEKKKSKNSYDENMIEVKIDNLVGRLDTYKDVLIKNELDKAKLQLKLEINAKIDDVEDDFKKKLLLAKKLCEKTVLKLKGSYDAEKSKLKHLIKELYDEINDYKCQVNSQEYKIELHKEKIITYEKEKKSQTDHAELLRVLTTKLSVMMDQISKR